MNFEENLLNYQKIVFSGNEKIIQVDSDSVEWGKQVLRNLRLENQSNIEKAQKICKYLSTILAYNFGRSMSIREILEKQGGNCVSHTLMGIFLLRLAGIPAKFSHEVHITKQYRPISLIVGFWAKKEKSGINSFWHNDHVWVWFRDGDMWEPFDTALGICGFEQFYEKRFFKHKDLSEGLAHKWTGPPFVIWEGVGRGLDGMKNKTSGIINPKTIAGLKLKDEWLDLVNQFCDWAQEDFYQTYLPDELLHRIKTMSIKWFKK